MLRRQPAAPIEPPSPDEEAAESGVISQFLGGVRIVPEQKTRLVEIVYESSDPQFATLAANTLADEYTAQNLELRLGTYQKNLRWLSEEVAKQEKKVSDAEAAMTQYRTDQNALSLGDRQNITIARLNALNETVTRQRTDRLQKEATYNQMQVRRSRFGCGRGVPGGRGDARRRGGQEPADRPDGGTRATVVTVPAEPPGDAEAGSADQERARDADRAARAGDRVGEERLRIGGGRRSAASPRPSSSRSTRRWISIRKAESYVVLQRQAESDRQLWQSLLQQQKELQVVSNSRSNNVQVHGPGGSAGRAVFAQHAAGVVHRDDGGACWSPSAWPSASNTSTTRSRPRKTSPSGSGCRCSASCRRFAATACRCCPRPVPHDFGEAFRSLRTSLVFTAGAANRRA